MASRTVLWNWRDASESVGLGSEAGRDNTLVLERSAMDGTERSLDLDARLTSRVIGMRC